MPDRCVTNQRLMATALTITTLHAARRVERSGAWAEHFQCSRTSDVWSLEREGSVAQQASEPVSGALNSGGA